MTKIAVPWFGSIGLAVGIASVVLHDRQARAQGSAVAPITASEDETPAKPRLTFTNSLFFGIAPLDHSIQSLINAPAVVDELRISPDQAKRLRQLFATESRRSDPLNNLRHPSLPDEQTAALENKLQEIHDSADSKLLSILSKDQRKRLKEIALQHEGVFAIARPEVAERLNMSPDQILDARTLIEQMQANEQSLRRSSYEMSKALQLRMGSSNSPEYLKERLSPEYEGKLAAIRQQMDANILGTRANLGRLLRPKQKARFNKLIGKPFNLARLEGDFDESKQKQEDEKDGGQAQKSRNDDPKANPAKPG